MFEDEFKAAYKSACKKLGDEKCADGIGDYVHEEVSAMGYPDEVASEVAQAAADKLRELSKCTYTRKPVEEGLTEDKQRASCKEAAEAKGYIVL